MNFFSHPLSEPSSDNEDKVDNDLNSEYTDEDEFKLKVQTKV